jgi:hypothetical protein
MSRRHHRHAWIVAVERAAGYWSKPSAKTLNSGMADQRYHLSMSVSPLAAYSFRRPSVLLQGTALRRRVGRRIVVEPVARPIVVGAEVVLWLMPSPELSVWVRPAVPDEGAWLSTDRMAPLDLTAAARKLTGSDQESAIQCDSFTIQRISE